MLMRPEAAFPYVFAAEGAQHPPKKPPRSKPCRSEKNSRYEKNSHHAERTAATTFRRRGNTIIPRDRADRDGGEP